MSSIIYFYIQRLIAKKKLHENIKKFLIIQVISKTFVHAIHFCVVHAQTLHISLHNTPELGIPSSLQKVMGPVSHQVCSQWQSKSYLQSSAPRW